MYGYRRATARRRDQLYGGLSQVSDAAALGLVWLLACLPIVTVIPATAALLATVQTDDGQTIRARTLSFAHSLRRLLLPGLVVEAVYVAAAAGIAVNSYTYPLLPPTIVIAFRTLTVGVLFLLVATFPYVVCLLATQPMPLTRLGGTALLLAVGRPLHTLACLAVVAATVVVVLLAPPLLLVAAPFGGSAVCRITRNALNGALAQGTRHA